MKRFVVLISGRGSNMASLLDASASGRLPAFPAAVISSKPEAEGLSTARNAGVETRVVVPARFPSRAAFDEALAGTVDAFSPELVILAGFMRILGNDFVRRFAGRLVNIHPSLLPAFPGLNTHRRALAEGVRFHGCTVHFVTPDLDHGPIIAQAVVPVFDDDDEASLSARVLEKEHLVLPQAVAWFVEDRLTVVEGRVRLDAPR
ncbi:MAG: phosphoribosylglycinamide formyltransferase [Candidatus Accumulibacter sp.]|jgi:phosphoribosylglycinamide formyltransferase-1|nr:phosphoribosylglycinamide formyltransferase [Accumulibacter sp.]